MKSPSAIKKRCITTTNRKYWSDGSIRIDNAILYNGFDNLIPEFDNLVKLDDDELPIFSYRENKDIWNLTTTHRVISKINEQFFEAKVSDLFAIDDDSFIDNDTKGIKQKTVVISYKLKNGDNINLKISTGKPCFSLVNCLNDLIWMIDKEQAGN